MAIDWSFWKNIPEVKLWQAAYLACDVDPDKKSYDDILNRSPFTRNHDVEASKLLRKLEANIFGEHFTESVQSTYPQARTVRLSEFSAWCLYVGIDIPQELASLSKAVPETEKVVNDGGGKNESETTKNWKQSAREIGETWMLEKRKEGKNPGVIEIAKYVEGEMSNQNIVGTRGSYLDWETIKREALKGITGRPANGKGLKKRNQTGESPV